MTTADKTNNAPDMGGHALARTNKPLADREDLLATLQAATASSSRPAMADHGEAPADSLQTKRQTLPGHEQSDQMGTNIAANKPNEGARPAMACDENSLRPAMPEQDHVHDDADQPTGEPAKNDKPAPQQGKTRLVAAGKNEERAHRQTEREVPPESADLVTVEEAVRIFANDVLYSSLFCAKCQP